MTAGKLQRFRDVLPNQRGSLYVEFLVLMPMFISLWLLAIYAFDYHNGDNLTQQQTRQAAWAYAMNGCPGLTPNSPPTSPSPITANELQQAAAGGFERITRMNFPRIGAALRVLVGARFSVERTNKVYRPVQFGGKVFVVGNHALMCATPVNQVALRDKDTTIKQVCRMLGGLTCQ